MQQAARVNPAPGRDPPEPPPWCVADTQVVLDWLVFADAAARPTLDALLQGQLRWLATPSMRVELAHMLRHPALARWGHDAERALAFFDRHAGLLADPPLAPLSGLRCRDPDDQPFIDAALVHGARWLLTRDRALLALRRKAMARGLTILRPADWTAATSPPPLAPG